MWCQECEQGAKNFRNQLSITEINYNINYITDYIFMFIYIWFEYWLNYYNAEVL